MQKQSGKALQGRFFNLPDGPDDSVERGWIERGCRHVAGVDEAGRGPLAGPVVAAAVILSIPCEIEGLNDSKKLSRKRRDELYEVILREAQSVGVGITDPEVIDELDVLQATLIAMQEAVESLDPKPDAIIVDGINRLPVVIPQRTVKKGDSRCVSIAAASIIAKVSRDRMMEMLHESHPAYGFATHKGYGTEVHLKALKEYGPCEAHRLSFRGVKELLPRE